MTVQNYKWWVRDRLTHRTPSLTFATHGQKSKTRELVIVVVYSSKAGRMRLPRSCKCSQADSACRRTQGWILHRCRDTRQIWIPCRWEWMLCSKCRRGCGGRSWSCPHPQDFSHKQRAPTHIEQRYATSVFLEEYLDPRNIVSKSQIGFWGVNYHRQNTIIACHRQLNQCPLISIHSSQLITVLVLVPNRQYIYIHTECILCQ